MKSKEYLSQIARSDAHIEQLKFELAQLEKYRTYVKALRYDNSTGGHGSGKNEASYEKTCDSIADLESKINREIEDLAELRVDAIRLIQRLDDPQHTSVLFLRYIQNKTFDEIVRIKGFAQSYVYRLHRDALNELDKIRG